MAKSKRSAAAVLARPWVEFNEVLMKLTEAEVASVLLHERATQKRLTFVLRLHSRLNRLRRERERSELVK